MFYQIRSYIYMKIKMIFICSILILSSCATEEKNLNTPEGQFEQAMEYKKSGRFEIAISKMTDIKNKYPYNSISVDSKLAIADIQFEREDYAEAQLAYQNFRDFHPKHAKTDYVIYQTAMSYYNQLPDTFDRDLSLGNDAIYHFDEIIKSYGESKYSADSKIKRTDVFNHLAEKELYVADFYFKQKKYSSALRRYELCLSKYSGFGFDPRAHLGALESAVALNDMTKKAYHLKQLTSKYPQAKETIEAESVSK